MTGWLIALTKSEESSLKIFLPWRHNASVNRPLLVIILLWLCVITTKSAEEGIWVEAKINGQPVRFAFDTGTGPYPTLYSTTAKRLGLEIAAGKTELCKLEIGKENFRTPFSVLEISPDLKPSEDGLLGWPVFSNNIISFDLAANAVVFFTNVPEGTTSWTKIRLKDKSETLNLKTPTQDNKMGIISIDTGNPFGVRLNPYNWHKWKATHTNQPITLVAYYKTAIGLVVKEESWAKEIPLGPLTLTDVPVGEADSDDVSAGSFPDTQYEATLGLAALKRLEVVIDGKNGIAYVRPKKTPPLPYQHNRLGAVFVPRDLQSDDLVAHVVVGSPAYEAGIRDGDILLKVGRDVANWRDPNSKINGSFREQPVGTKSELTLKRGDKVFKTTAVLRNILPPDAPKNSN